MTDRERKNNMTNWTTEISHKDSQTISEMVEEDLYEEIIPSIFEDYFLNDFLVNEKIGKDFQKFMGEEDLGDIMTEILDNFGGRNIEGISEYDELVKKFSEKIQSLLTDHIKNSVLSIMENGKEE